MTDKVLIGIIGPAITTNHRNNPIKYPLYDTCLADLSGCYRKPEHEIARDYLAAGGDENQLINFRHLGSDTLCYKNRTAKSWAKTSVSENDKQSAHEIPYEPMEKGTYVEAG